MVPNQSMPFPTHLPPPHLPPLPALPRLALDCTFSRTGMFDGAWWPRSRDLRTELPNLITALAAHFGPIARVGLDTGAWDAVPRRLMIDGAAVHVGRFSASDHTISITRGLQDHVLLLVIPPLADPATAATAMAAAAHPDNHATAAQLLGQARPG